MINFLAKLFGWHTGGVSKYDLSVKCRLPIAGRLPYPSDMPVYRNEDRNEICKAAVRRKRREFRRLATAMSAGVSVKENHDMPDSFKYVNGRALRCMRKGKPFIVIAQDEPYFKEVYDKIRESEKAQGRWTDECELDYLHLTGQHDRYDMYARVADYLQRKGYAEDCAVRHAESVIGAPYGPSDRADLEDCPDEGCPHYGKAWCIPHKEGAGCLSVYKDRIDAPFISEAVNKPRVHCCPKSPSGYCEYDTKADPMRDDCLHCHDPYERK